MGWRRKARSVAAGDWRFKADVLGALIGVADIRKTVGRGDGGIGTLTGCVDSVGTLNATGIIYLLVGVPTYASKGIMDGFSEFHAKGIFDTANWAANGVFDGTDRHAWGTFSSAAAYNQTGVIYGIGFYATEASRNYTDAAEGDIVSGHSVTLLGATTAGTLDMSLWTELSGIVDRQYVLFNVPRYTGDPSPGTYATVVQSDARRKGSGYFGAGGILDGTCYVPAAAVVISPNNVDATTGTYVAPVQGQVLAPAQGGTAYGAASGTSGTLTFANTTYVLNSVPDYGIAGTGKTGTATIPAGANVQSGAAAYGIAGSSETPAYATTATTQAADAAILEAEKAYLLATKTITFGASHVDGALAVTNVLTAVTGGTYHAPEVSEVQKGAVVGTTTGTLVGTVDTAGAFNANGIIEATAGGTYHAAGLVYAGAYYTSGILSASSSYATAGVFAGGSNAIYLKGTFDGTTYRATGVIYGTGDYATEASRNSTTAAEGDIVSGHSVTLLGVTTAGTLNMGLWVAAADNQLKTDSVLIAAISGTIIKDGEAITATTPPTHVDGTYDPITGNYTDPGKAAVLTGNDYYFAGVLQVASYSGGAGWTFGSNSAAHVLTIATAPGTFNATNLAVGNVIQDVAFGVSLTGTGANLLASHTTYLSLEAGRNSMTAAAGDIVSGHSVTIAGSATAGTLDMTLYTTISTITWPATDEVDGGVTYGISNERVGTGVNATTIRTALGLATANLDTQLAGLLGYVDVLPNAWVVPATAVQVAAVMTTQMTESYAADGVAPTPAQSLFLIQQSLHEFTISGTTRTVKKIDGAATAATFTLDSDTAPTSTTRAT